jgi:thiosulfate/3-mercaptopyruvate sulfurtransferase
MEDPLVSTAWLAERLDAEEIRIADGSWHMPATSRSGAAEFREAHIPGAVFFDIDAIADHDTDLPHMLPAPEAFAQAVGALGLSRDKTVVVYDSVGLMSAARVWWALRAMGFPQVVVLDGGLPKWRAEGRPLEAGEAQPRPAAVEPRFDPTFVRSIDDLRGYLASGEARLVDARAAARFRGEAPEPRAGLRAGHMPGAANVPFGDLLNPDGTVKDAQALRAVFQSAGVDLGRPIVTSCGSGVTAAVLSLGLARLGVEAPVYDGSWTEWGGRADTEVVTGP